MDNQQYVGRELTTRTCLGQNAAGTLGAERCVEGPFCIQGGACIRLNASQRACGRASDSGQCLDVGQLAPNYNVSRCAAGYCIEVDPGTLKQRCMRLDAAAQRFQKHPITHMCMAANIEVSSTQYIECAEGFFSMPVVVVTASLKQTKYKCVNNIGSTECWYNVTEEGGSQKFDVAFNFLQTDTLFYDCANPSSSDDEESQQPGNVKICLRVERDMKMLLMVGRDQDGRCIQL